MREAMMENFPLIQKTYELLTVITFFYLCIPAAIGEKYVDKKEHVRLYQQLLPEEEGEK